MDTLILGSLAIAVLAFPLLAPLSYKLKVLPTTRRTYLFWAAFSLLNFSFLAPLAFPPLLLISPSWFWKFAPFMLPPLLFSMLVVAIALLLAHWKVPRLFAAIRLKPWAVYACNGALAGLLLVTADQYKDFRINAELEHRRPSCVRVSSFATSLMEAGHGARDVHAMFVEDGKHYLWSYAKGAFVAVEVSPLIHTCPRRG